MASILILCPTFDHAETLFASVASVWAQRFTEWELVVIGDGAPDRTVDSMEAICYPDRCIRYESHPKSERYGEIYRDRVIRESGAEVVLQVGDDDLWAPDHIDCMLDLMQGSDWANQAPLRVTS
jgi:glycosyltransferase involved in cell wall biosynthesis